ncbi:EF-hand domain-containing family member C2 [Sergentomyia squamirostris]
MIELYPPKLAQNLKPAWLQYDKKVLCFDGYFEEIVDNSPGLQIRTVKISFFLEDGTMQVIEPKTANSGIPQGCIVKRQKIPAGELHDRIFLSVLDLNVGKSISIFNRIYHITDCDQFTRSFLNNLGISVPSSRKIPTDRTSEIRRHQSCVPIRERDTKKTRKFAKFLENDGKVLRFTAFWDDTQSNFGYIRDLVVLFYLSDGTMEIWEHLGPRKESVQFLKRMKLPRKFNSIDDLSFRADFTVLNVFREEFLSGRFIRDSKADRESDDKFISEKDLQTGKTIDVFGRKIVLMDCDEFTKIYCKTKYGQEEFAHLERPLKANQLDMLTNKHKTKELPPFNGWGTHLDSETNCKSLEPKAPQEVTKKFLSSESQILRFGAKIISKIAENCERIFIITFHLSDDTISVYEKPIRNSGFTGGKFLHKKQFFLPNQNIRSSVRPEIYKAQHFYIGTRIQLSDHVFEIVSADCYVFNYMEKHQNSFPYSNIENIMTKIRDVLRPHYKTFIAQYISKLTLRENGELTADFVTMKEMLKHLLKDNINTHEIITVCRYFHAMASESSDEKGSVANWNRFIEYLGLEENLCNENN